MIPAHKVQQYWQIAEHNDLILTYNQWFLHTKVQQSMTQLPKHNNLIP